MRWNCSTSQMLSDRGSFDLPRRESKPKRMIRFVLCDELNFDCMIDIAKRCGLIGSDTDLRGLGSWYKSRS